MLRTAMRTRFAIVFSGGPPAADRSGGQARPLNVASARRRAV